MLLKAHQFSKRWLASTVSGWFCFQSIGRCFILFSASDTQSSNTSFSYMSGLLTHRSRVCAIAYLHSTFSFHCCCFCQPSITINAILIPKKMAMVALSHQLIYSQMHIHMSSVEHTYIYIRFKSEKKKKGKNSNMIRKQWVDNERKRGHKTRKTKQ